MFFLAKFIKGPSRSFWGILDDIYQGIKLVFQVNETANGTTGR
jgi:hypothetical protein